MTHHNGYLFSVNQNQTNREGFGEGGCRRSAVLRGRSGRALSHSSPSRSQLQLFTDAGKWNSILEHLANTEYMPLSQTASVAPVDSVLLPSLHSPLHLPEIDTE